MPPTTPSRDVTPDDKAVLKEIARLGGLHDFVSLASGELADRLGVSQQTASRKILSLLDGGLITRRMGTRRQLIRLAAPGVKVLRAEFAEYKAIFEAGEQLTFHGRVVAGLGEGKYYISRPGYRARFEKLLGFEPFPGTLNIEVDPLDREKMAELRELGGLVIREFEDEGRTFGAVKCFRATVATRQGERTGAAILPVRSHHTNVLEVIAPESLRDALTLKDGTSVTVDVRLEDGPSV